MVTRGCKGLRGVTRCYKTLQGGYNGLLGITRGYDVNMRFRGLQGAMTLI